jgi:hypothetical protein
MAAKISFLAGAGFALNDLAGSGLGFYGDAGFGASVKVGDWQGRTFVTNGAGTGQGPEVDNVKYLSAGSGVLGQSGTGLPLQSIPNYQSTLNVRFTYDSPVQVQNAQLRIYDRTNPDNPASGVTTKVAQLIHPDTVQNATGSGDTAWNTPGGSGSVVNLAPSPGCSGLFAGNGNDGSWKDTQHDWYLAISSSPDSIGSKTLYGCYIQLEFL